MNTMRTRVALIAALVGTSLAVWAMPEGLDPTGKRDRTAAIQQALDGGGVIRLPAGRYSIQAPLKITRSGTSLIGEPGTTLYLPPGQEALAALDVGYTDQLYGLEDIVIRNITLENDLEDYAYRDEPIHHGILMWGVQRATIENCTVRWFNSNQIALIVCHNVDITGTRVWGGRHGIALNGHYENYSLSNVRVENCYIARAWDTFIPVGLNSHYVTSTGCQMETSGCHGIDIFNSTHVVISNNIIRNWLDPDGAIEGEPKQEGQACGIFVHPDWPNSVTMPTQDITITGNIVVRDDYRQGLRPVCLEIHGNVEGVTVSGNLFTGGHIGCALVSDNQTTEGNPARVRDVVVTGNVWRGQKMLSMWLGGKLPVGAFLMGNEFRPATPETLIAHMDAGTLGLSFLYNIFPWGRFPEVREEGILWRDNLVGPHVTGAPPHSLPLPVEP